MKVNYLVFTFWTYWSAAGQTPPIAVRVYNYAGVSENILEKAKLESQRVLRATTFEMRWIDCPLRDSQRGPRYLACEAPMSPADILLRIVPRGMQPPKVLDRSLGYSLPFIGKPPTRAYVLYDHLRERVRTYNRISEFRLLGYVMAHEIAHLLFLDDRHSPRGVMMAYWREMDLEEIERGTLAFSPDEIRMLTAGWIARIAK